MLSLLHFTDIHIFATENRWPRSPVGGLLWHHCGHKYGWSYHLHARNAEQWQLWPSAVYSKGCRALLPKTCQQNLLPKQVLNEFFPQPHFIAWAINQAPPNLTNSWTRTLLKGKILMQTRGGGGVHRGPFGQTRRGFMSSGPKYKPRGLQRLLDQYFESNPHLDRALTSIIIPTFDTKIQQPVIFSSWKVCTN